MKEAGRPVRVRLAHVEWVRERLGERDWEILATVGRLRLASSTQLERLHFADLLATHRSRTRRRVLARLAVWRVLTALERRIGGVRAGSAGLVFALDSAGQWLASLEAANGGDELNLRRPAEPSGRLAAHTLGVAELYVRLREAERRGGLALAAFSTEPACWWPNGLGGWLKPDARLVVAHGEVTDHWWLEQDQATQSLPTIRRKTLAYLDFVRRGLTGPGGVVPRVLVSVPTEARRTAVQRLIDELPPPGSELLLTATHEDTAGLIVNLLRE